MTLTIALSGMDNATETALRAAFSGANAQVGGAFALVAEPDAEHVIVDMDSMYGPMSWLRLHAAGKQIIGLTSAPRVQTHFRLGRPFDDSAMAAMLCEIAASQNTVLDAQAPVATAVPLTVASGADARPAATASSQGTSSGGAASNTETGSAAPVAQSPVAADLDDASVPVPGSPPAELATDLAPSRPPAVAEPETVFETEPELEPEPEPDPDRALPFSTWIAAGVLRGRRRYRSETGPTLWLDFDAQHYHGPSTLKPLSQYFAGTVTRDAFEPADETSWTKDTPAAGAPQPLIRLVWLGGLLAGEGHALAPGHDPDARYQLTRWPQTEREYPRHFRIATAMMKGPATLDEIIAASGLPSEEVIRFVNANLATGYAEPFIEAPEPAEASERSGGFFSRLRRR